jgi:hypothetical protein
MHTLHLKSVQTHASPETPACSLGELQQRSHPETFSSSQSVGTTPFPLVDHYVFYKTNSPFELPVQLIQKEQFLSDLNTQISKYK